ncbi:MAG: hypothetical protein RIQ46_336, partial [Pseudomonadota bacterium]
MRRRLSESENRLWKQVAQTVKPLPGAPSRRADEATPPAAQAESPPAPPKVRGRVPPPLPGPATEERKPRPLTRHTLDSTWDRRITRGEVQPDFTLDLHGATLDAAHARLEHGLSQALAQGARVLLLITGRARPVDDRSLRGERRGVIRAKFM